MMKLFDNITEQDSRTMIDTQLKNHGWKFAEPGNRSAPRNVYQEGAKPADREKLGKLRPDYVLYRSSSDRPLAIVEAKKENGDFAQAKYAGLMKARKIKCPIVFVSDGRYTRGYHAKYEDQSLIRNGEEVRDFLPERELEQFTDQPLVTTANAIESRGDLVNVFKQADRILRRSGVEQGFPRLFEFCNLLFLKMMFDLEANTQISTRPPPPQGGIRGQIYACAQATICSGPSRAL